jgi:hypothetical protein
VRYALLQGDLPRLSLTWDAHAWDPSSLAIGDAAAAARCLPLALDRLRSGGLLHTAVDTPRGAQRLGVPILGREVRLSRALATLARVTGAPALPVAAGWEGERLRIRFGAPLPTGPAADAESWERAWLSGYARWYEGQLRGAAEDVGLDTAMAMATATGAA